MGYLLDRRDVFYENRMPTDEAINTCMIKRRPTEATRIQKLSKSKYADFILFLFLCQLSFRFNASSVKSTQKLCFLLSLISHL